jgi:hypothetical protein
MPRQWVIDVEGVTVCEECWDEEMREWWPRLSEPSGATCEGCEYVEPEAL